MPTSPPVLRLEGWERQADLSKMDRRGLPAHAPVTLHPRLFELLEEQRGRLVQALPLRFRFTLSRRVGSGAGMPGEYVVKAARWFTVDRDVFEREFRPYEPLPAGSSKAPAAPQERDQELQGVRPAPSP